MSEFFKAGKKSPDASKKARRARMRQERIESKQRDSAERQAYSDSLSIAERIANLDAKFGPGLGATKERASLSAKLEVKMGTKKIKNSNTVTTDQTVSAITETLVGQIQSLVQDVSRIAREAVEEEMRKGNLKKSKNGKISSKRKV